MKQKQPTNPRHVRDFLRDCWKTIAGDYLMKPTERMPRVFKAVVKANGGLLRRIVLLSLHFCFLYNIIPKCRFDLVLQCRTYVSMYHPCDELAICPWCPPPLPQCQLAGSSPVTLIRISGDGKTKHVKTHTHTHIHAHSLTHIWLRANCMHMKECWHEQPCGGMLAPRAHISFGTPREHKGLN